MRSLCCQLKTGVALCLLVVAFALIVTPSPAVGEALTTFVLAPIQKGAIPADMA